MPPVGWKRANGVPAAALELSRFVESGSVRLTRRLITFTALSLRSQTRLGHQRWAIGVPARTAKGFLIPGVQQSKCRDIKRDVMSVCARIKPRDEYGPKKYPKVRKELSKTL